MNEPYLSVVIVGRNDDYGVNFMSRINTFVRSLDHQVKNYPNLIELIVVEWNPLSDRPGLKEVLVQATNLKVRIITVPPEVHNSIGHSSPVLEYYGKNVGIRRARGKFVLITNPDIVFTNQLIDIFSNRTLNSNCFYRTDRYDFISDGVDSVDADKLVDFALEHTFQGHLAFDTGYASADIEPAATLETLITSKFDPNRVMHTNGCGDFILASREAFYAVRGVLESVEQKYHLDSISLFRLALGGYKQVMFISPFCIFHQHHERTAIGEAWDHNKAVRLGQQRGSDTWGLRDYILTEQ